MTRAKKTASVAVVALLALLACSTEEPDPNPRENQPVDGGSTDATPRREAGIPTRCGTYAGSTASDACSCGEDESPFGTGPIDACPINELPHYCVSYDVTGPPLRRECTCQPKCVFQKVTGGGGDGGSGEFDTCRCGVASFLLLGGPGSRDDTRATCEGYTTCCKFATGCDCTNQAGYACPADTTQVTSCTPDDFSEGAFRATVYGGPMFADLVTVPRCK
ncbi:MAG: hypothetical protein KF819_12350 [Labilithrix sp.]|nr:hypothetical protein [Labilithrix sp.]